MRTEYWQKSEVTGWKTGGEERQAGQIRENVLHRRGEDPLVMACRRNHELAGMDRIQVRTEEAFMMEMEPDRNQRPDEIPRMGSRGEEWEWD